MCYKVYSNFLVIGRELAGIGRRLCVGVFESLNMQS